MIVSVSLRPFKPSDLPDLWEKANNFNIARNLMDGFPHPYKEEDGVKFLERVINDNPTRTFAIEFNGEFCGAIGLHPQEDIFRKNAELGYWLEEKNWGKGIMTEAVKQIVEYGFSNFEFTRIFARPFGYNKASARVLEKAGFELEAELKQTIYKNDEFFDELIYAVRK